MLQQGPEDRAADEQAGSVERDVESEVRRRHPIRALFLLDVIGDPASRPALLYAMAFLLAGMFLFHIIEGWNYLDSFYFCVITLATVGYGDYTPHTPLGKILTVIYVINGIAILLALFDRIRDVRSGRYSRPRRGTAQKQ